MSSECPDLSKASKLPEDEEEQRKSLWSALLTLMLDCCRPRLAVGYVWITLHSTFLRFSAPGHLLKEDFLDHTSFN